MGLVCVNGIDRFQSQESGLTLVEAVPIMMDQRTASAGEVVFLDNGDLEPSAGKSRSR